MLKPNDCPEYPRCSAPICPLDADWRKRIHAQNESVCLFTREHVKPGADEQFARSPIYGEIRTYVVKLIKDVEEIRGARGEEGMPMGLGLWLRGVMAAAKSGSTLAARQATGSRARKSVEEDL